MTKSYQSVPNDPKDRYFSGDTVSLELTVETNDGSPKDLSGSTVKFGLSERNGASPVIEKDTSNSDVEIVDAENGRVDVLVHGSETKPLGSEQGADYHYEISVEDNIGDSYTVTTGTWIIYANTI